MTSLFKLMIFVAYAIAPNTALACAVCGFGKDGARAAFIFTTGLLTFIPLIMIGSVIYILWRRAQRAQQLSSTSRN